MDLNLVEVTPDDNVADFYAADNLLYAHDPEHQTSLFDQRRDFGGIHVVVAKDETGTVVGAGTLLGEISLIDTLAVDPEHRQQGLGHQLLSMLEVAAKAEGIDSIQLCDYGSKAVEFFEKAGYIGNEADGCTEFTKQLS